ncbi:Clathrin heavy chain, partial [Linderina macrospora]
SLNLSKKDKLYKDAMTTARQSGNTEIAEDLLRYFVESGNPSCFTACLYTCYDLVRSDVVMELAWRHGLTNEAMPYFINLVREYQVKVDNLTAEVGELKLKVAKGGNSGAGGSSEGANPLLGPAGLGGRLMIGNGPTPGAAPNVFGGATPGNNNASQFGGSQFGGF